VSADGQQSQEVKMSKQTNPTSRTIKIPGPDHPITIEPNPNRVVVSDWRHGLPLGRLGLSEEVADGIVFIASDQARFITGHVLNVDGGHSAN
jgi:NAD(P)-dependent dehydrogenase (short-subunit alcohol dehydrogenase family)